MIDLKELEALDALELIHVAQQLLSTIESKFTATTEAKPTTTEAKEPITLEKLRALLAQYVSLDTANNRPRVKELLGAYGAVKLSEVEASDYEAMYKEVSIWLTQS